MILEVAILTVKPDQTTEFEAAFKQASPIIASMKGYASHQLQRCIEVPNQYILLVNWQTLEDHTVGFRGSAEYQEWRHYCITSTIRFRWCSIMRGYSTIRLKSSRYSIFFWYTLTLCLGMKPRDVYRPLEAGFSIS